MVKKKSRTHAMRMIPATPAVALVTGSASVAGAGAGGGEEKRPMFFFSGGVERNY